MSEPPLSADDEADDATILNDDFVYRRVHDSQTHTEPDGSIRPHSGAFEDKDDGMSAFLHTTLVDVHGAAGPSLVASGAYERHRVVRISVRQLRHEGCGITRDPDPPETPAHDCNCAHVLVHLPKLGKKADRRLRKAIVEAAEWYSPD